MPHHIAAKPRCVRHRIKLIALFVSRSAADEVVSAGPPDGVSNESDCSPVVAGSHLAARVGWIANYPAHLAYWSTSPLDEAALKRWAKACNARVGSKIIDPALYTPVQAHYVAAPLFDGLDDPLPRASGKASDAGG